eukprot:9824426-Lingulodinium_polyedra.AAC.1
MTAARLRGRRRRRRWHLGRLGRARRAGSLPPATHASAQGGLAEAPARLPKKCLETKWLWATR